MYLSRPKITPCNDQQLAKKPSVTLHRGAGNQTTLMVLDEDQTRHPVTKQFLSRFQNQQSDGSYPPIEKTTNGGLFTDGKRKGP